MPLKTLEEHNKEKMQNDWSYGDSKNGIACPKCGKELFTESGTMLLCDPPMRSVYCECGYRGAIR